MLIADCPPGGECPAAGQSLHQEEQGGDPVPDSHTLHLCGERGRGEEWNMGEYQHSPTKDMSIVFLKPIIL